MTSKELRIAGAMLYVGEGTKLRKDPRYKNTFIYAIELTNSDPQIVSLFIKFLKEELEVDFSKVRGQLFIYPDLNREKVMQIWSRKTGIPIAQFQKVIMLKPRSLVFRHSPLGTFKVRMSSKEKFLKLQSIIESVWKSV